MEKTIETMSSGKIGDRAASARSINRLGEVSMFAGVVLLSSLAVAFVAIAAPFVLAASALTALFTERGSSRGWRPVSA